MSVLSPSVGVTVSTAADYYGVSEKTIYRWIAEARISAVRVGPKLWRIQLPEAVAE